MLAGSTIERRAEFRRNESLEAVLESLNDLLSSADGIRGRFRMPIHPIILIVGCPRSGTSLMLQWLAHSGLFAYPTNLMSRFYKAPYIGAQIQRILTDPSLAFRDEFCDVGNHFLEDPFKSEIGKTRGISAPNVFWYFWRRFFPDQETHSFSPESLANVDTVQFAAELAAIESVFDKPLALKAMLINWIIPFISSVLDKVLFVFMQRDPFYTIQSVLETREKFFADRTGWWSFKPKEYPQLVDRHPVTQVTGQIYYMNQAVTQGLDQISSDRQLHVSYRDFCQDPSQVHQQLRAKLAGLGHEIPGDYFGPSSFEQRDSVRISEDDRCRIIESYREFSGVELAPTQGAVGV